MSRSRFRETLHYITATHQTLRYVAHRLYIPIYRECYGKIIEVGETGVDGVG